MRRISITSESLSHWHSRCPCSVSGKAALRNSRRFLAQNPAGCVRHISFAHDPYANSRRWEGPRPHRKPRPFLKRASIRALQTLSEGEDAVHHSAVEQPPQVECQSPEEDTEYTERFYHILKNRQPNQVMDAMVDPRSTHLVQQMPEPMFVDALHLLSPDHFILPYRTRYRPLHWYAAKLGNLRTMRNIFDDFKHKLATILRYRTASGKLMHLAEYSHLLKCAAAMGDGPLANQLWKAMETDGVVRDGNCYHYYMEARVWDHCHHGAEAYRMRMLPWPYKKRKHGNTPGWEGYGTAQRSVRRDILQTFNRMNEEGHPGDERSYVNVLLGSARVGHKAGLRSILKIVWNVDVDAIKAEPDNSKLPPVTPYDPWSSLYPTNTLLFAVANALGTTNDGIGALRTVDFISSSYNIRVSDQVWYELFERIFELVERHRKTPFHQVGEVPRDLLRRLLETMTSEPHNVKPTHWMYRCMVKIGMLDFNWQESRKYLYKAYAELEVTREKRRCARELVFRFLRPILKDILDQRPTGTYRPDPAQWQSPQLAEAIHAYDILRTQHFVEAHHMKRIAYAVITTKNWWDDIPLEIWERQIRPKLMEEWRDFLPSVPAELKFTHGSALFGDRNTFFNRDWRYHPYCSVLRRTNSKILYKWPEPPVLEDNEMWQRLRKDFPELNPALPPINRLFDFERIDPQVDIVRKKLKDVPDPLPVPPDHPLSREQVGPWGLRYARLQYAGIEHFNDV